MRLRTVPVLLLLLAGMFSTARAITVDELIQKNIDARGGIEKLRAIKTMRLTGKQSAGGFETPFSITQSIPNKMRIEATVQGKIFVIGYDGTIAWVINPFAGSSLPERMADKDAEDTKEQADILGPLIDSKEKGYTIEYAGEEDMEGTKVHKLKLTNKEKQISYIYLDAETGIDLKRVDIRKQGEAESRPRPTMATTSRSKG